MEAPRELYACARPWGWGGLGGSLRGRGRDSRLLLGFRKLPGWWGLGLGELPAARALAPPSVSSGTCWLEGLRGRSCYPIDSLPGPIRPRLSPRSTNPRVAAAPLSRRARPSGRCFRVGPRAEEMAPWALLSPGVLVRTGHTVLTWGITLVLFLHDTGEPDPARPRTHPIPRGSPDVWVSLGLLLKPQKSWDSPHFR